MSYFITVKEVLEKLNKQESVHFVDARYQLLDPEWGKAAYNEAHIPGAVHLDLKEDLSGAKVNHGGAHPLPMIEAFSTVLGNQGMDGSETVVIYGAENDIFAARAWWMIHHLGHETVYYLKGGFKAWKEAEQPTTNIVGKPQKKKFKAAVRNDQLLSMEMVRDRDESSVLIDARDQARFLGGADKLHKVSGHIPGAKNYFWKDVLTESGEWLSNEALQTYYEDLPKERQIILSCGSGVSACIHLLALKELGYDHLQFYPGSFSDWISYEENEISTED